MADDTSKSLTPSDLIPADTLAALPLWSEEGLREEIETQLQAAADAMRWDWIPPRGSLRLGDRYCAVVAAG